MVWITIRTPLGLFRIRADIRYRVFGLICVSDSTSWCTVRCIDLWHWSVLCRWLLHFPRFQSLELAWRGAVRAPSPLWKGNLAHKSLYYLFESKLWRCEIQQSCVFQMQRLWKHGSRRTSAEHRYTPLSSHTFTQWSSCCSSPDSRSCPQLKMTSSAVDGSRETHHKHGSLFGTEEDS